MNEKSRAGRHKGTLALMVIAAFMAAGLLVSCAKDETDVTSPVRLIVNGTEVKVPYVMTISGKKISLDEYRYYFLNMKYTMDNGDSDYWAGEDTTSLQSKLKANALYAMKETYAVEALAQELSLSLTDDEQAQIDNDVKNQIATLGGSSQYRQALSENYLTDDLYRFLWKTNFYCEKLWIHYFSEDSPYYNQDPSLDEEALNEKYSIQFKALIAEKVDQLTVELTPEYDLITIESLT